MIIFKVLYAACCHGNHKAIILHTRVHNEEQVTLNAYSKTLKI